MASLVVKKKVIDVIKNFPTNTRRMLEPKSYFHVIYSYLVEADNFLEIGYRKGIFVEICKTMNVFSVHVDISDDLLKAKPTKNNICITSDSIRFLKNCTDSFGLIFQDGSKELKHRRREYDLIINRNILASGGVIIVDDLHYTDCMKAYSEAIDKFSLKNKEVTVKDKKSYKIGILTRRV